METNLPKTSQHARGFTLLLTIIVIGVVLAITLTSLNLAIKQVQLSADTRDSEVAFHAANAGLECIRHWRRANSDEYESSNQTGIQISCFGNATTEAQATNLSASGSGHARLFSYQTTWGDTTFAQRCSQMHFLVMVADLDGSGLTVSNMPDHLAGYPENTKSCEPGGRCTAFASQGYSTECPSTITGDFPLGTIQREILVEF